MWYSPAFTLENYETIISHFSCMLTFQFTRIWFKSLFYLLNPIILLLFWVKFQNCVINICEKLVVAQAYGLIKLKLFLI